MISYRKSIFFLLITSLIITGCSQNTSELAITNEAQSRFSVAGISNISVLESDSFAQFFSDKATTLDVLEYTARYLVKGSTVVVERSPESLVAEISLSSLDKINTLELTAYIRLSKAAALICINKCVSISTWLSDPLEVDPPKLNGDSVAKIWDIFVETGAHDPNTVAYIPNLALTDSNRVFYKGERHIDGVGLTECVGYLSANNDAIAWCFSKEGVWASGPSQSAILEEVILR
jgi:hypothetical protein